MTSPPLMFFYPHFSCVRARDLKFYDFSNNVVRNVVDFFCWKFNSSKMVSKLSRAINETKYFLNFSRGNSNFFHRLLDKVVRKNLIGQALL